MSNKQFFSGLEEALARLVGVILTLTFFLIYIWAVNGVSLSWLQAFFAFGLFWLVYEAIAFGLFILFDFFAKKSESETSTKNPNGQDTGTGTGPVFTGDSGSNSACDSGGGDCGSDGGGDF